MRFPTLLRIIFLYILLGASLLQCVSTPAIAQSESIEKRFSDASASYRTLRRTDGAVRDPEAWLKAGDELLKFYNANSKSQYAAPTLLALGRLYERVGRSGKRSSSLERATYFYALLAREFKGNSLADDALLSLGQLRENQLNDPVGARAAYFEIVDLYKHGDQLKAASERLKELDRKSGAAPESDLAVEKNSKASPTTQEKKQDPSDPVPISPARQRALVVVDAGHGGEDKGAVGAGGLLEKNVTLAIALQLQSYLEDRLGVEVVLTRTDDRILALQDRIQLANDRKADLFVSIHTNASELKNLTGVETYYLDNTQDRGSLKLAERENLSLQFGSGEESGDLGLIVGDLIQNAKLDDSVALAHNLQESLIRTLNKYYKDIRDLGVKKAPFYVLVGAHMPCVLTEVSFIDHPVEGKRLGDTRYQRLIAQALYEGVKQYLTKHPVH